MYILKCGYENLSVNNNYTKGEKVKFQSNIGDKLVGYIDRYAWLVEFLVFLIWRGIKFGKFTWSKWRYYTSSTEEGQWNGIRGLKKERKEGQWNGFQLLYWSRGIFFIWKSGKKLIIDVTCRPDVTFMGLLSYAVHALH